MEAFGKTAGASPNVITGAPMVTLPARAKSVLVSGSWRRRRHRDCLTRRRPATLISTT